MRMGGRGTDGGKRDFGGREGEERERVMRVKKKEERMKKWDGRGGRVRGEGTDERRDGVLKTEQEMEENGMKGKRGGGEGGGKKGGKGGKEGRRGDRGERNGMRERGRPRGEGGRVRERKGKRKRKGNGAGLTRGDDGGEE
ncbi:hypothetical protein Tco_0001144 [Tanacetum coccineum]